MRRVRRAPGTAAVVVAAKPTARTQVDGSLAGAVARLAFVRIVAGTRRQHDEVLLEVVAGHRAQEPVAEDWAAAGSSGMFRVYRRSRAVRPEDDIAEWLGRTMAMVHQLQPLDQVGLPDWWRAAIRPRSDWEEWFTEARQRGEPWADRAWERLPRILELTARIEEVCETAPDLVMTHGDFKSHNLLMTASGPVLIDWDSVRADSAALEAGRMAHMFGAKTLDAYVAAGGDITWAGNDLNLSVVRNQLQGIFERILVLLDRIPAPRWMADRAGSPAARSSHFEVLVEEG